MPDQSSPSLLFEVFALNQQVGQLLREALADGPLSPDRYAVYSAVFEDETITLTALAARLGMPLTTAAEHVRRLERLGHARRLPNPQDGRSFLLTLTAEGRRAHRAANTRFEQAHRAFVEALPIPVAAATEVLTALRLAAREATRAAPTQRLPK